MISRHQEQNKPTSQQKKGDITMTEIRFCYACYCNKDKDVKMIYHPGKGFFGSYECPECSHKVDKKTSEDTENHYI